MISNGVDLIEIDKAKRIYVAHKDRLGLFFSSREIAYIQKGRDPHEKFAVLLAAKESAFKAVSRVGIGLSVFKDIEMIPHRNNHFSVKFNGLSRKPGLKFFILKNQKYVVVQCAGT